VDMFHQSQEAVNQRVDSFITTIAEQSKVEVFYGDRKLKLEGKSTK